MKPMYLMTIMSQQKGTGPDNKDQVLIHAEKNDTDDTKIYFEINTVDAVLFPVGTKISITVESLEA